MQYSNSLYVSRGDELIMKKISGCGGDDGNNEIINRDRWSWWWTNGQRRARDEGGWEEGGE